MSGASSLIVQPCSSPEFMVAADGLIVPLTFTAGFPDGTPFIVPAAQPNNLASQSPPTLLEAFDVYAVAISYGWYSITSGLAGAELIVELDLLINDQLAYSTTDTQIVVAPGSGGGIANGRWTADLVNPVRVNARERLGIAAGFSIGGTVSPTGWMMIGAQTTGADFTHPTHPDNWAVRNSVISYAVIDVPAARRL